MQVDFKIVVDLGGQRFGQGVHTLPDDFADLPFFKLLLKDKSVEILAAKIEVDDFSDLFEESPEILAAKIEKPKTKKRL